MDSKFRRLVGPQKSVMIAADVQSRGHLIMLLEAAKGMSGITAIKFGITLGLRDLGRMVATVKCRKSDMKVIYDHQKAGNDIPAMGSEFAQTLVDMGVDAAILFPFTGPVTQCAWTEACFAKGLEVIVGGEMTHEQFLHKDGGYIADDAPRRIYALAADMGVQHFVVPGNKPDAIKAYRLQLEERLGVGSFSLYSPGFITQNGDLSAAGQAAGDEFHGIIGSAIYKQPNVEAMRQVMIECTSKLTAA